MNKIAQEKAAKALQFLASVSLEVLREADQGTRGMALARLRAVQTPEFESIHVRRLGSANVEEIDLRVEGAAEIAAASEALATVEEHVRRALCSVLDRLGGDGATAFMNGDSPEKLSDEIFAFTREQQDRVREEGRRELLPPLKRSIDEAEFLATTYGHYADVSGAPADFAARRALHPALAKTEPDPPLSPLIENFFDMRSGRDNALTKLDVANEVIREVRGVCKAGDDEETVIAVRRVARLAYASAQFIASLAPAVRAPKPTDEAVAAWGREFEAAAVRRPRRKEG